MTDIHKILPRPVLAPRLGPQVETFGARCAREHQQQEKPAHDLLTHGVPAACNRSHRRDSRASRRNARCDNGADADRTAGRVE